MFDGNQNESKDIKESIIQFHSEFLRYHRPFLLRIPAILRILQKLLVIFISHVLYIPAEFSIQRKVSIACLPPIRLRLPIIPLMDNSYKFYHFARKL